MIAWLQENGGSLSKIRLQDCGGDLGLSLIATESVTEGDAVMSVPLSACMTIDSAAKSGLSGVLEAHPALMDTPDEVLALHLMHERRKGDESFWKHYIRSLPDDVDTPVRWTFDGAEELSLLDDTMVGLLTRMLHAQIIRDWRDLHEPLVEDYPEVLGGLTLEDYTWAMSSIWSRSFDYQAQSTEGPRGDARRAMVPALNAANHDISAAACLADIVTFHPSSSGREGVVKDREAGEIGTLRVSAGRDYNAGEQFYILYGRYSNAKLLYSYGFVLPNNPFGGLDYWVKIPPTDPGFQWKQALLDGHPLTAMQAYDFSGTLRLGGWLSPALLATARVAQLTPDERPAADKAFHGSIVTPRNEAAALGSLVSGLRRKLAGLSPAASVEAELVESLEEAYGRERGEEVEQRLCGDELASRVSEQDVPDHSAAGDAGKSEGVRLSHPGGGGPGIRSPSRVRALRRQLAAARVRLEEKIVLTEAIAALEASLGEISGPRSRSFQPLDGQTT